MARGSSLNSKKMTEGEMLEYLQGTKMCKAKIWVDAVEFFVF